MTVLREELTVFLCFKAGLGPDLIPRLGGGILIMGKEVGFCVAKILY